MKTNKLSLKSKVLFLLTIFFVSQSFVNADYKKVKENPLSSQVSYIGEDEQFFLFKVTVDREGLSVKPVKLNIRANNQDDIFEEFYSTPIVERIYKINKTDIERISFSIMSNKTTRHFNFDVNRSYSEKFNVRESK